MRTIISRGFSWTTSRSKSYAARLPKRSVLSVTGSQATPFVNSMIAKIIPSADSDQWGKNGGGIYTVFLNAQVRHTIPLSHSSSNF